MFGILFPHCTPWSVSVFQRADFFLLSEVDLFIEIINILFNRRLKKEMDNICSSDEVHGMTLLSVTHDTALQVHFNLGHSFLSLKDMKGR